MTKEYSFEKLDMSINDFKALLEENRSDVYFIAAMTVVALCNYRFDYEKCYEMISSLRNPKDPISPYQKQFIRDRLGGKDYKPYSFINGAVPQNNYVPFVPYKIAVDSTSSSFAEEGWATLRIRSSGADHRRIVKLRQKKSTGDWYLVEEMLLADIREPYSSEGGHIADEWG